MLARSNKIRKKNERKKYSNSPNVVHCVPGMHVHVQYIPETYVRQKTDSFLSVLKNPATKKHHQKTQQQKQ